MIFSKKVRKEGSSLVISLPADIVNHFEINPGDLITLEYIKNLR